MVDRAHVNESAQWALETTPGTAVPANKQIRSMSVTLGIEGENESFRPDGHKWTSLVAPNMEWTSFRVEGKPTYTELCYPLESIMGAATLTSVVGSTGGKRRVYTILDTAADSAKTLTIEKGSSVRAEKIAYGLFTELGLTFSRRNGVALTGGGMGQLFTDGITKTASPTALALVPILGKQLDIYIDSTGAGLGTTKMLRAFSLNPQISNKYGGVWPIDSAQASYAGHVELVPTGTVQVRLEADAAGMAYLSQYRSGDLIFVRIEADGPEYETGYNYKALFDYALGIKRITGIGDDEDGVTVVNLECEITYDATWAKAIQVTVENAVATL